MLKMPRMIAVVGATLVALLIAGTALAQQSPPHLFFGFDGDTMLDGESVAPGTEVMAMADGASVGSATVGADGTWSLEVDSGTSGVTFMVGGMMAEGSYDTSSGGQTRVKLSVTTPAPEEPAGMDGTGEECPEEDSLEGDSMSEEDSLEGDSMSEECPDAMDGDGTAMTDDDDSTAMTDGDDDTTMTDGDDDTTMMEGADGGEGSLLPDTGTGGLADRGTSSAVYGGIAGSLALVALLAGGFAIRRRVRS